MDPLPIQALSDLCYIHIAHLLLCRNTEETWLKITPFESLDISEQFLSDVVEGLPVPKSITMRILNRMGLVVGLVSALLRSWFPKHPLENCLQWVTGDMLYGCLVLKGNGMIDQRKTAEKLLRSRKFDDEFAFRLACVNFLEKEVLQLWPHVRKMFLNTLMMEEFVDIIPKDMYVNPKRLIALPSSIEECVTEPREVLFWIRFCLLEEKAINIKKIPHFAGHGIDWYKHSLDSAAYSRNVACFDYLTNEHIPKIEYNRERTMQTILSSMEYPVLPVFIFHFDQLNSEGVAELFEENTLAMVDLFLQWPLSVVFESNPARLWDLVDEGSIFWAFLRFFVIMFYENTAARKVNLSFVIRDWDFENTIGSPYLKGIYSLDHLRGFWIGFWSSSSDSCKSKILDTIVLKSIERSAKNRKFYSKFKLYGLERKLRNIFLTKEEAVLELYDCENLKESLTRLVSKYLPEDSERLHRNCISFLGDETKQLIFTEKDPLKLEYKVISDFGNVKFDYSGVRLDNTFLKYIKRVLS